VIRRFRLIPAAVVDVVAGKPVGVVAVGKLSGVAR
jgi:hypothetical protein